MVLGGVKSDVRPAIDEGLRPLVMGDDLRFRMLLDKSGELNGGWSPLVARLDPGRVWDLDNDSLEDDRTGPAAETTLDLGDEEFDAGELTRPGGDGDVAAVEETTLLMVGGGDMALEAAWDVDVAWCIRVGGALAMAFALARLAAICAATLLFFVAAGGGATSPKLAV
jgi:hypothetical protein